MAATRYIVSGDIPTPIRTTSPKGFAVAVWDKVEGRSKALGTFATPDDAEAAIYRDRGGWSWFDNYRWGVRYNGVHVACIVSAWELQDLYRSSRDDRD